jgi:DNA-directed RNA polymerase subunit RPC12/RpoP
VAFLRGMDDSEPVRPGTGTHEKELRVARADLLAVGTLACSRCDAPVALTAGPMSPAEPIACPFCAHRGRVRDFLTLGAPSRPARVEVRVTTAGTRPFSTTRTH